MLLGLCPLVIVFAVRKSGGLSLMTAAKGDNRSVRCASSLLLQGAVEHFDPVAAELMTGQTINLEDGAH